MWRINEKSTIRSGIGFYESRPCWRTSPRRIPSGSFVDRKNRPPRSTSSNSDGRDREKYRSDESMKMNGRERRSHTLDARPPMPRALHYHTDQSPCVVSRTRARACDSRPKCYSRRQHVFTRSACFIGYFTISKVSTTLFVPIIDDKKQISYPQCPFVQCHRMLLF